MKEESHITYFQLLEIISWGIFSMKMKGKSVSDKRLKKYNKIDNAMHGGVYTGSPGKDIYYMLKYLSEKQMVEVVFKLAEQFPCCPSENYVNVAACIRFIYGQFEKQGILRSEQDFKRMKNKELDWSLSRKFLKLLENKFKEYCNFYGLAMIYEMDGHRLGDEAVINNDKNKLEEMEKKYNKCVKYANKCKSYKHLFSIYYWASKYFIKFGDVNKAIKYAKLSIENAVKYYRKYFPNGEKYYRDRLFNVYMYIGKNDKKSNWKNFKNKYDKYIKNNFKK